MKKLAATVILLAGLAASVFANGESESELKVPVREGFSAATAAGVNIQWRVEDESIVVQMAAMTTGWVAVGFDPSRKMADANIIIGYVTGDGVFVRDDYGIGAVRHGPDVDNGGTDDVEAVEGYERDGATVITFAMPLDSGDPTDKPLVPGNSYRVIVSHGPNNADDFGTYHASRGSFEVEVK